MAQKSFRILDEPILFLPAVLNTSPSHRENGVFWEYHLIIWVKRVGRAFWWGIFFRYSVKFSHMCQVPMFLQYNTFCSWGNIFFYKIVFWKFNVMTGIRGSPMQCKMLPDMYTGFLLRYEKYQAKTGYLLSLRILLVIFEQTIVNQ